MQAKYHCRRPRLCRRLKEGKACPNSNPRQSRGLIYRMSYVASNNAPTAVAFDLDGVIANSEDLYEQAGETVLGRRGKTYDADLRERMMGRPVVDALKIMIECHSLPDPLDDLMCECKDVLQALM